MTFGIHTQKKDEEDVSFATSGSGVQKQSKLRDEIRSQQTVTSDLTPQKAVPRANVTDFFMLSFFSFALPNCHVFGNS